MLWLLLVPQKAAGATGSEGGMDCGTKRARAPYGKALRREARLLYVRARWRVADGPESERKRGESKLPAASP